MAANDKKRECPCGYTGRIDNVTRHMKRCKRYQAAAGGASTESLLEALVAKDRELDIARAKIAQLEAQLKAQCIKALDK